jgi:hypothetical protein
LGATIFSRSVVSTRKNTYRNERVCTFIYFIVRIFFSFRDDGKKIDFIPLKRDRRSLHLNTMGAKADLVRRDGQTIYFYYRFILISAH